MTALLDLSVELTPPPALSAPEVLASISVRCDALGLSHSGDLLTNPLSSQERQDLRWYLEEYWKWPYEQFLTRSQQVEALLPAIGQRLYQALFVSREADRIIQKWLALPEAQGSFQLSILSNLPAALSLPWELLHSEQGFLALRARRPISIVRRLPQSELTSESMTTFTPPLRILLVTARPENTGFVDPRSIARELLAEVHSALEAGTITVEFLRPPTLQALQERLHDNRQLPIHILHFDGHGIFGKQVYERADSHLLHGGAQGMLAFETEHGQLDLVSAERLAQLLQDSSIQLAVLTACQSAMSSEEDAFSSVAARLIRGGVKAVSAMSASVLVVSATRYTAAFYRELAAGADAALAQERSRQDLYADPRRHTVSRTLTEAGEPVKLSDWWLPHFYQQQSLSFHATSSTKRKTGRKQITSPQHTRTVFNTEMPTPPRYGFAGRSRELLQLERWLRQGKLVVIYGFGGMGKTALATEAANWLTLTRMYDKACFVSFEGGRNSALGLLSQLGSSLGIYESMYTPENLESALGQLQPALKRQRILIIADNLESILTGGDVPLEAEERRQLWDTLLDLQRLGAGVLLTSRSTAFGDGRLAPGSTVAHLPLKGLEPEDAYLLASSLLTILQIDRRRAPYAELRGLLRKLDYHPLAIQLVLPMLRTLALAVITADFEQLLPKFSDETETGRNRSLLASLEYSLQRLKPEHHALLPRLAPFEGGAIEDNLLFVTEIPETVWAELRPALEQSALLTSEPIHEAIVAPFLHFHPALTPYLQSHLGASDHGLSERYMRRYLALAASLYLEDERHPIAARVLFQRELPNLRKAFTSLLEAGHIEEAAILDDILGLFLEHFGLMRERELLQQRLANAFSIQGTNVEEAVTRAEYFHESNLADTEYRKGNLQAATVRIARLLARIESHPKGTDPGLGSYLGAGSYEHTETLLRLARFLVGSGQFDEADGVLTRALTISDLTLKQQPDKQDLLIQQSRILALGSSMLLHQGQYSQAQAIQERALEIAKQAGSILGQATSLEKLGVIAREQRDYEQAEARYLEALAIFRALGQPEDEAGTLYNLGTTAEGQQDWEKAERYYRQSLAIEEQLGDLAEVAQNCNGLGIVAQETGRFKEAKGWFKRALALIEQTDPNAAGYTAKYTDYLCNLAYLLVLEVQAGHVPTPTAQLVEARGYAQRALALEQSRMGTEVWRKLSTLATIAKLEGKPIEERDYSRQAQEAYAAFIGNRQQADHQHGKLISILAAAQDNTELRAQLETILPQLDAKGWPIAEAMHQIWAGKRDWYVLAEGLHPAVALIILRVLETIEENHSKQEAG